MSKPELRWRTKNGMYFADANGKVYCIFRSGRSECDATLTQGIKVVWESIDNESLEAAKAACERHWKGET